MGNRLTPYDLEKQVRESAPLFERLEACQARIAQMCSEGRPPKMSIPAQWNDDDVFIIVTLKEAAQQLSIDTEQQVVSIAPSGFRLYLTDNDAVAV